MRKQLTAVFMAGVLGAACVAMAGCGQETSPAKAGTEAVGVTETGDTTKAGDVMEGGDTTKAGDVKEGGDTTEAADILESAKNGDGGDAAKGSTAILVVSFGTSYNENRKVTIEAIEEAVGREFGDYEVRRAFTSQIIIDKLKERDGLEIDNVEEALDRAVEDGVANLVVQPTHLMDGYEYTDLANELKDYEGKFSKVVLGEPLLSGDEDFDKVVKAIVEKTAEYDDGKTAICFMGHGTEADSNRVYPRMQETLRAAGHENYFIGTVEAEPALEDVMAALKEKGSYKRVVLEPLMVVAGDHANNDMAGDEEDSWKSILENEGYEVECVLEGLGQIPAVRDIYVEHVQAAMEQLGE